MKILSFYLLLLLLSVFESKGKNVLHIKHKGFKLLKSIPEPSDIVFDSIGHHYYIVSDHGYLFECDTNLNVVRKAEKSGLDFEGIDIRDGFIYISDETPREVYKYRMSDLAFVEKYPVSWGGAANKAFESISYNYVRHCFVLVAQQPTVLVEYDSTFKETGRYKIKGARNIAGARWHNGLLYLLSSLDASILVCDPNNYNVTTVYHLNVLNPEGISFDDRGQMRLVSDDTRRVYYFDKLPILHQ